MRASSTTPPPSPHRPQSLQTPVAVNSVARGAAPRPLRASGARPRHAGSRPPLDRNRRLDVLSVTRAGVSRGAMLHHFPSRFELIRSAIEHLNGQRLANFERTELRKILLPAIREFDSRWFVTVTQLFPDLSHSRNFMLGNFLTLFLLEGMAVNQFTRRPSKWTDVVLDDLKSRLSELFGDIAGVSDRKTAPRQLVPRQKNNAKAKPTLTLNPT